MTEEPRTLAANKQKIPPKNYFLSCFERLLGAEKWLGGKRETSDDRFVSGIGAASAGPL